MREGGVSHGEPREEMKKMKKAPPEKLRRKERAISGVIRGRRKQVGV